MERVLALKANWLAAHGYEVTIVTTDQRGRKPFFNLDSRIVNVDLGIGYEDNNGGSFADKLIHYPRKKRSIAPGYADCWRLLNLMCVFRCSVGRPLSCQTSKMEVKKWPRCISRGSNACNTAAKDYSDLQINFSLGLTGERRRASTVSLY